MVLAVFTRCVVPKIQICCHFWLKSPFLGPNSIRTNTFTAKPMAVGCVQHYSTHFVKQLGKSLESFYRKVQKTAKMAKIADFSKISNFWKKSVSVTFEPLLVPNFIQSFGKILRAVIEIICYARTDAWTDGQGWFYKSHRFSTGDQLHKFLGVILKITILLGSQI